MTPLFLVREDLVPVEDVRPGDRLILPSGARVTVECVDSFDDGLFVVRWWRRAERGEPGHPGAKDLLDFKESRDGRFLGSLMPVPAGHCWRIDRA